MTTLLNASERRKAPPPKARPLPEIVQWSIVAEPKVFDRSRPASPLSMIRQPSKVGWVSSRAKTPLASFSWIVQFLKMAPLECNNVTPTVVLRTILQRSRTGLERPHNTPPPPAESKVFSEITQSV